MSSILPPKLLLLCWLFLLCFQLQAQTKSARVTRNTSLRADEPSKSKIITRLKKNQTVIFLGDCDRFYCKVEWEGNVGWVKKSRLEVEAESAEGKEDMAQEIESPDGQTPLEKTLPDAPDIFRETNASIISPASLFLFSALVFLLVSSLVYACLQLWWRNKVLKREREELQLRYQGIADIEAEVIKTQGEVETLRAVREELSTEVQQAKVVYLHLQHESNLLKDDLEIREFGFYEPRFDYATSAIYKLKIKDNREAQKELIQMDLAVVGGKDWNFEGDAAQGKALVKRQKKLMLRALNGECDSLIQRVRWNNVTRMEERILKSAELISKLGDAHGLHISSEMVELKLLELRLTYETELKKEAEREVQREIRERIRDEQKALKEYEKVQQEALKEERLLQEALRLAREQMQRVSPAEKGLYEARISELEAQLQTAEEKNKRAMSMAQQTKAGHVYVISNIGSFGENIYKIGMTRRLEPLDRVHELGSASVPFRFDVHALIYSEDAPALEALLHAKLDRFRVNRVNLRREYFRVSLKEIERVVRAYFGEIEFLMEAEAQEFRESLVMRGNKNADYFQIIMPANHKLT